MGTATVTTYTPVVDVGDVITAFKATVAGDITRNQAVVVVDDVLTAGDSVATCTRALKVLTADKIAVSGNMTRALDIVTSATPGSLSVVKIGDSLEINSGAAGIVIEIIDNTNVRVNASGTIGANTGTYQRPLFAKVHPGAALVLATGTTAAVVESKTSDFVINTVASGTVATGLLTSYQNLATIVPWKEDNTRGEVDGIAMATFTYTTAIPSADIQVKMHGVYARNTLLTADTAAGSVTTAIHDVMTGRGFQGVVTQYNEF